MRPRALIDLVNHCRSVAVNLHHARLEEEDIKKGMGLYSDALVTEIDLEIRDVMPQAGDLLYHLIGAGRTLGHQGLEALLLKEGRAAELFPAILNVLLWHGVLGLMLQDGRVEYIYTANYNMRRLLAQLEKLKEIGEVSEASDRFERSALEGEVWRGFHDLSRC